MIMSKEAFTIAEQAIAKEDKANIAVLAKVNDSPRFCRLTADDLSGYPVARYHAVAWVAILRASQANNIRY